jgi:uncharacterized protein with FMN-binding domain
MRRAILALGGTAAGIGLLLSFKTHPAALAGAATGTAGSTGATGTPAAAAGSAEAAGATPASTPAAAPAASARRHRARARAGAGTEGGTAVRTVAGSVAETVRGPMQVELTLAGQRITRVTMLQRTNDGAESDEIDATAIPKLISETLSAQSAHIDAVSGATYTSTGYIQSLQSALDKAAG